MTMRLTGTLVLVLGVLVFAGSAYAGNENGNGKGNDGASPGNSANAPGQVKKDDPAPAPETTTSVTTVSTAPAATTFAPAASAPANSTGVKPSNDTAHDTHAEAQSDKTKEYGNGQTAGQIAEQNGAAGNTSLHGPGNSQPHKAAPCSGGHEVDVHALKSHRSGSCGGGPTPHSQPDPGPTQTPSSDPKPSPDPKQSPDPASPVTTAATKVTTIPATTTTGEQKPPQSERGGPPAEGDAAGEAEAGTQSATERIGHAATLPFTGQRLWLVALFGVILILTGLALREIRTAEASVESGHDHTDRSRHAAHGSGTAVGGRPGR
jgi:hypothetical protein